MLSVCVIEMKWTMDQIQTFALDSRFSIMSQPPPPQDFEVGLDRQRKVLLPNQEPSCLRRAREVRPVSCEEYATPFAFSLIRCD
jgi:hypothetical protein